MIHLVARGQSHGYDDIVVVDEFPRETIDRGGAAGRHDPQARHAPQGRLSLKLLGREGLDVKLGQRSAVDLTTRVKTLARRKIRSREANDHVIAIGDGCDAARTAHGQAPARCALSGQAVPEPASTFVGRSQLAVQFPVGFVHTKYWFAAAGKGNKRPADPKGNAGLTDGASLRGSDSAH